MGSDARKPWLRPAFWLWLCLSAVPPELIAWRQGWDIFTPAYTVTMLLWWPFDTLGRLGALRVLLGGVDGHEAVLGDGGAGGPVGRPYTGPLGGALIIALSAEISVGLRSSAIALLGLVPATALLSVVGLESRAWRLGLGGLAMLGLVPAFIYLLKRALAPLVVLLGSASSGREALDGSIRQMDGKIGVFLRGWLPWIGASFALNVLSLGLPEGANLFLAPLSLLLDLIGLLRGWRRLA